jgi:[ribosomal protein S18]-alanine N-acetyltransferase
MGVEASRENVPATIRAFVPDDMAAVTAISAEAREAAHWTAESYRKALEWPGVVAFVHHRGGNVTSFILGRRASDEGEILNLAVTPASRRRGEGTALLKAVVDEFRGRHVSRVFLEVRGSNESAIAFYEKRGFFKTGCRAGYYRDPDEAAVLMEIKLGD